MSNQQRFIKNIYEDGDKDYQPARWFEKLENLKEDSGFNLGKTIEEDKKIKKKEVGIFHPDNEAIIKVDDDGSINLFSSEKTGIRIDKENDTIIIFGNEVQFMTNMIHYKMHAQKIKENKKSLKKEEDAIYTEYSKKRVFSERVQKEMGWDE